MKKSILVISLLLPFFSPLRAKEETVKDAGNYIEEVVFDDPDPEDFGLDDFAEDRKDDPPPQPKDLSFTTKLKILLGIITNVTSDWYHDHIQPNLVGYWQHVLSCINMEKNNEQESTDS